MLCYSGAPRWIPVNVLLQDSLRNENVKSYCLEQNINLKYILITEGLWFVFFFLIKDLIFANICFTYLANCWMVSIKHGTERNVKC